MSDKDIYRGLCEQEHLPLMMQAWWLDAVCIHKHWDVLLYRNAQDEVIAAMSYLLRQRAMFRYIVMPQHTQIGGIWLSSKATEAEQQAVADCVAQQLKQMKLDYYYQQFAIGSPLPKLLEQRGFRIDQRKTYRIEDTRDIEQLITLFSQNKRRQLKKASALKVNNGLTPREFYDFHCTCLKVRKRTIDYSYELFECLYSNAHEHDATQIIALQDENDVLLAAAMVVWDDKQLYYLLPALLLNNGAERGAGARLAVECMRLAQARHIAFDFEGSMAPSIANHYRQFATTPTAYYSVTKLYKPLFALLLLLNQWHERLTMR